MTTVSRSRLAELIERERALYISRNPKSQAAFEAADHLFGRVPMTWMNKWSGGFPLYLDRAWAIASSTSTAMSWWTLRSVTLLQ